MIEFKNVSKQYGRTIALDNFSTNFGKGKIFGLFGPNGAGKSTSMKMMAGLSRPDKGLVLVDGQSPQKTKHKIAYLPEIDYLYSWMNIKQAADFVKTFYGDWDEDKYQGLLGFLRLDEKMNIGKISKGQRAKAKLLLTVSRGAPYLLLDEPLSGIDILTREEIINTLISDFREGEQTIIISTHEIAEIESLVDEVTFISAGQVKLTGNAEDLRAERGQSLVELMKELFKYES
ncbi:MAG TPA: ABC transporter ATP-binding protein [Syntrophomonadaceae bacterium]|nr:ABC transporter ATP-binding protein [Syntrophomonadaceae bacterium]